MKRIMCLMPVIVLLILAGSSSTARAWGEASDRYPGRFRVIHAAAHGPPVNVMINGSVRYGPMWYGGVSPYISLKPSVYNIKVITADRHQTPVYNWDRAVVAGQSETIIVTGEAQEGEYWLVEDIYDWPINPEEARLQFVNLSSDAGLVDVVGKQGEAEEVWFSNMGYKAEQFKDVGGGMYDIEIRQSGSDEVLLEIPGMLLPANSFVSLALIGTVEGKPGLSYLTGIEDGGHMQPPGGCLHCPPAHCSDCGPPAHLYQSWGYPHAPKFPYDRSHIYPWLGPPPHFLPWVYKYQVWPYFW